MTLAKMLLAVVTILVVVDTRTIDVTDIPASIPAAQEQRPGRTAARGNYRAQVQSAPHAQTSPQRHPGRRSLCPFWQPHVQMAPVQDLHAQALRVVVFVTTCSCEVG
jgi:hypothetical protein